MDFQRGFGIFGNGFAGKTAHIIQRPGADGRRAAKERAAPAVQPAVAQVIEHLVFRRAIGAKADIALYRIGVQEEMRGLDQKEFRVFDEIAHGAGQKIAAGDMVGIEHHHQIAIQPFQRGGHVARFGMFVARAGGIDNAQFGAEVLQLCPALPRLGGKHGIITVAALIGAAIITQHHRAFERRVMHVLCGRQGDSQHLGRLVITGNQNIDCGQICAATLGGKVRFTGSAVMKELMKKTKIA
jgi:hypothetical protein